MSLYHKTVLCFASLKKNIHKQVIEAIMNPISYVLIKSNNLPLKAKCCRGRAVRHGSLFLAKHGLILLTRHLKLNQCQRKPRFELDDKAIMTFPEHRSVPVLGLSK